jgi:hypothetical protein
MYLKFLLSILIVISIVGNSFAQTDINAFWKKFQNAVVVDDKATVAKMTKFPFSMPYGFKTVKNRLEFLKRYDQIMDLEANSKRCFASQKIEKEPNPNRYFVNCTFKSEPESSENRPIFYYFQRSKSSWKFVGLDNANE